MWGLEHFNLYLEGHKYTTLTDHHALIDLIANKESTNKRLTRWILRLQPYHLKIQFIKGSDNHLADLLSRSGEMMEMKANATSVVLSDFLSGDGVYQFCGTTRMTTRAQQRAAAPASGAHAMTADSHTAPVLSDTSAASMHDAVSPAQMQMKTCHPRATVLHKQAAMKAHTKPNTKHQHTASEQNICVVCMKLKRW